MLLGFVEEAGSKVTLFNERWSRQRQSMVVWGTHTAHATETLFHSLQTGSGEGGERGGEVSHACSAHEQDVCVFSVKNRCGGVNRKETLRQQ